MPVVDAKALFAHAIKRDYALAAFNISSLDSLQAVLWAAEAEASPVIAQVLRLTEEYVRDVETYLDAVRLYAGRCKVPVLLQHDHCSSVGEAKLAIDRGFGAVMYDGSSLSFEENAANSAEVARYAHERGVWLEAELGSIPGMEDNCFTDRVEYTSPELARRFISETGCDSLAVSVGTAHGGVAGNEHLPLDFDRLEALVCACPGYPLVLHGAASMPDALREYVNLYGGSIAPVHICSEADIARACRSGVRKANMDVDNWLAYTGALRQFFSERPGEFFPTAYLEFARNAWENEVRHKLRKVVGSSGMATDFYGGTGK